MSSYENIYEILNGPSMSYIGHQVEDLTVDQRIAAAQAVALASIAEEISKLNPANTSMTRDGTTYNGWGMPQPK